MRLTWGRPRPAPCDMAERDRLLVPHDAGDLERPDARHPARLHARTLVAGGGPGEGHALLCGADDVEADHGGAQLRTDGPPGPKLRLPCKVAVFFGPLHTGGLMWDASYPL